MNFMIFTFIYMSIVTSNLYDDFHRALGNCVILK